MARQKSVKERQTATFTQLDEPEPCAWCKKIVTRCLDLKHTRAVLCSLTCEQSYWLDVFY